MNWRTAQERLGT